MKSILKGLQYSFHIMVRPFDGFWDMRHEKRGNIFSAIVLVLLLSTSTIIHTQYTGFIFNTTNPKYFNFFQTAVTVIFPFILWCVANWSITSLTDGEGRFVDIFMMTAYALVPYILINFISVLISNVITFEERAFLNYFIYLGIIWSGFILFVGIMTIHQFTPLKTIFTIIITVIGMVVIVFLLVLVASIIDKLYNYIFGIIVEIRLRM